MDPDDFVAIYSATDDDGGIDLPPRLAPTASSEREKNPNVPVPVTHESTVVDDIKPKHQADIDPAKWSTLSSLVPLFQLLPSLKEQSGYYTICGPVTDTDVSKLRAHAQLVHTLSIDGIPSTLLASKYASRCSTPGPVIERSQSPRHPAPPPTQLNSTGWGSFDTPTAVTPLQPSPPSMPLNSTDWGSFGTSSAMVPSLQPSPPSMPPNFMGWGHSGLSPSEPLSPVVSVPVDLKELEVAAAVYTRLTQHLCDRLLPSLESLHLNMQTVSTTQLQHVYPLLVGSTLRELELNDIQAGLQHVTIPLLSSLPYQAPALEKLILRGLPQSSCASSFMGSITMLTELRHLELHNVLDEVTPEFLHTIGSLPELMTLVLRDGKAKAPAFDSETITAERNRFRTLRNIDITASFKLILCFLRRVGSTMVESIVLSPVVDDAYDENDARDVEALKLRLEESRRAQAEAEAKVAHIAAEEARAKAVEARAKAERARAAADRLLAVETVIAGCPPPSSARYEEPSQPPSTRSVLPTISMIPQTRSVSPVPPIDEPVPSIGSPATMGASSPPRSPPPPLFISWAGMIVDVLTLLCSQWASLRDLDINLFDTTGRERIFQLPSQYLDCLEALEDLESFRLNNWKINQHFETTIRALVPRLPKLKILHFPLGKFRTPVNLRTLEVIAMSCPALEDLQVGVSLKDVGEIVLEKRRATTHPLRILSVGSDSVPSGANFEESRALMVTFTRTLDGIFPQLQDITTHSGEGSKFWEGIHDFLWVCQNVRDDERFRTSKPAKPGITKTRTLIPASIPTPGRFTMVPPSTTMKPTSTMSASMPSPQSVDPSPTVSTLMPAFPPAEPTGGSGGKKTSFKLKKGINNKKR